MKEQKSYQFIYFYMKDHERVPVLAGASYDLSSVVFPTEKQALIEKVNAGKNLLVWIDGTEFLI